MGILILIGFLVIASPSVIAVKKSNLWFIIPIPLVAVLTIIISIFLSTYPPVNDYPNQATVTLSGDEYKSTIYFSQFRQDSNKVVIDKYCIIGMFHWTDFNGYDVINTALIINLTDNDNKFIYEDRLANEEFNNNNIATQP